MDVSYCPRLHVGQFECKILRWSWSNMDGDFHKGKRKKKWGKNNSIEATHFKFGK